MLSIVPAATAPPPDQQSPTASVEKSSGPATVGDLEFFFTVDYQDNVAVAGQTIDSQDVLVTGPNNFSQIAPYVGDAAARQPDDPGAVRDRRPEPGRLHRTGLRHVHGHDARRGWQRRRRPGHQRQSRQPRHDRHVPTGRPAADADAHSDADSDTRLRRRHRHRRRRRRRLRLRLRRRLRRRRRPRLPLRRRLRLRLQRPHRLLPRPPHRRRPRRPTPVGSHDADAGAQRRDLPGRAVRAGRDAARAVDSDQHGHGGRRAVYGDREPGHRPGDAGPGGGATGVRPLRSGPAPGRGAARADHVGGHPAEYGADGVLPGGDRAARLRPTGRGPAAGRGVRLGQAGHRRHDGPVHHAAGRAGGPRPHLRRQRHRAAADGPAHDRRRRHAAGRQDDRRRAGGGGGPARLRRRPLQHRRLARHDLRRRRAGAGDDRFLR